MATLNPVHSILAGLRLLQERIIEGSVPLGIADIATNAGANVMSEASDIDALCEDVNTGHLLILNEAKWDALVVATEIAFDDKEAVPPDMREIADQIYADFHPPRLVEDEPDVNDEPPPDVGPPGSGAVITEYEGNEYQHDLGDEDEPRSNA